MVQGNLAKTPLLTAMQAYLDEQVAPFHTPGHKMGKGAPAALRSLLGSRALAMDLTVLPGLGDLFDRQGPIQDAQLLAARLYGADATYFLVNGTTCGIYAMILAAAGPGDKIIMPRNVHRSVLGGLILSGAVPVFIAPEVDPELQIAMNVSEPSVEEAVKANPDAKAVLLVNPTYYGAAADIRRMIEFSHAHSMPVLVDEAHGPHLHFSSALPPSALDAGADIVVQSTHKLLGSLSQSSLLHCRRGRISTQRLETMLQMVQSSSPNYLLLASLEAAMAQMAEAGGHLVERSVGLAEEARRRIARIPGLFCFGTEKLGQPGVFKLDTTKLTVTVSGLGMRGNEAALWLRREGGVQAELADWNNVLFLVTLGDDSASIDCLVKALSRLAAEKGGNGPAFADANFLLPQVAASQLMSPRDAMFSPKQKIAFKSAVGRICAETVVSYPPGIPLLLPGERIMPEMLDYCLAIRAQGFTILGPEDPELNTIGVVA